MCVHRQIATYYSHFTGSIWCHQQRFVVKRPAASYSLVNQTGVVLTDWRLQSPLSISATPIVIVRERDNFYKVKNRKRLHNLHAALLTLLDGIINRLVPFRHGGVNN